MLCAALCVDQSAEALPGVSESDYAHRNMRGGSNSLRRSLCELRDHVTHKPFVSRFELRELAAWTGRNMDTETKTRILQSAKTELIRHSWDTFVDEQPSVAAGGMGVVIPGCPACHKRITTNDQYLRHLSDDVLPVILRKAFEIAGATEK